MPYILLSKWQNKIYRKETICIELNIVKEFDSQFLITTKRSVFKKNIIFVLPVSFEMDIRHSDNTIII